MSWEYTDIYNSNAILCNHDCESCISNSIAYRQLYNYFGISIEESYGCKNNITKKRIKENNSIKEVNTQKIKNHLDDIVLKDNIEVSKEEKHPNQINENNSTEKHIKEESIELKSTDEDKIGFLSTVKNTFSKKNSNKKKVIRSGFDE